MGSAKPPFAERENLSGIYPVHNVRYLSGSDLSAPPPYPLPPAGGGERVSRCRGEGCFACWLPRPACGERVGVRGLVPELTHGRRPDALFLFTAGPTSCDTDPRPGVLKT